MMDRAWIFDLERIDPVYIENVRHFVEEANFIVFTEKTRCHISSNFITRIIVFTEKTRSTRSTSNSGKLQPHRQLTEGNTRLSKKSSTYKSISSLSPEQCYNKGE
jgi:hypothetical protein